MGEKDVGGEKRERFIISQMKEQRHTDGPWKIVKPELSDDDQVEDSLIIKETDGKPEHIAEVFQYRNEQNCNADGVALANACLIAAAPELLAACKYALGVLESIPGDYAEQIADILDESINTAMIETAIAKAGGIWEEKNKMSIDFTKILEGYEGKWVAISNPQTEPKVIGSGTSIEEAIKQAAGNGDENATLMRVPEKWVNWIL